MQKLFTIIVLTFSLASYGQHKDFAPFTLVVLKPDTALIDKSLYGDIDSVQSDYLQKFHHYIQQMELLVDSNYFSGDTSFKAVKENMEIELAAAKTAEPEIKKFKYYHTLSTYSTEVYNVYFNEYKPFSTIIEFPSQNTDIASLKTLVDTSKADYVVFFSKVHTEIKDGLPILKLTTSLYSRRENKIILTKETEGDINSRGDMWTCGSTTLSCLLINGVRTSTNEVAPVIAKAQMRK